MSAQALTFEASPDLTQALELGAITPHQAWMLAWETQIEPHEPWTPEGLHAHWRMQLFLLETEGLMVQ